MRIEYKRQAVNELAATLKTQGFRVFIAESGAYGFYTNDDGSRVVSFQCDDLRGMRFTGNYKTSAPRSTGTGWELAQSTDYAGMMAQHAPQWATHGATWKYTTLAQHLKDYQSSSRYVEFKTETEEA